jgi:hypothetical protein
MVAVFAGKRCGQTGNVPSLGLPHHLFERESGNMVALVHNH